MSTPSEHKTVQARILGYAEAIGWAVGFRGDLSFKNKSSYMAKHKRKKLSNRHILR